MESDQNRPQAEGVQRPPADPDPGPGHAGESEFSGFRAGRPQADRAARTAADNHQGFAAEPDFSGFKPDFRESLLPRWLHLSLLWLLGLGAAAALVMAGMFVTQERKTDKTLELLAASSRAGMDVPATPAAAPLAGKKPSDMVFLPDASKTVPAVPNRADAAADRADAAAQSASPAAPLVAARQGGAGADSVPAVAPPAVKAAPAKAAPAKAAPAKAKQVAKKKKPKPKKATALARRGQTQTWPRRRGDSITERLNAAVAACRARPHAPGECNLRACDILGSSDPACR